MSDSTESPSSAGDTLASGDRDPAGETKPHRKIRDAWDKLELLGRPISGLLAALSVAILGIIGQQYLSEKNRQDLYTNLMNQREESESDVRARMFQTILAGIIETRKAETPSVSPATQVSEQMLKLELLALNFGESLNLGPLFRHTSRMIDQELASNLQKRAFHERLFSLARHVGDWQFANLKSHGDASTLPVSLKSLRADPEHVEPEPFLDDDSEEGDVGGLSPFSYLRLEVEGVPHLIRLTLSNVDPVKRSITVSIESYARTSDRRGASWVQERDGPPFTLDYFDFPMVDNTRLLFGHRIALVAEFRDKGIGANALPDSMLNIDVVCFPGVYTSQRDKPVFQELMAQMRRAEATHY